MVQERRKLRLILLKQDKRIESVRTIEELSLEIVPQTFKDYFQNFQFKQQFAEMLPTTYIFQSRSIYNIARKVVWSIRKGFHQ